MKLYRFVILGNVQNYYSYFLYGALEGAIHCGAWAKTVQLVGRSVKDIRDEIDFMKPHFILCHMIFGPLRYEILEMLYNFRKKFGTRVVYHMGDAREVPRYPKPIDDFVDLALVNNGIGDKFSDIWKVPCIHWPYMALYQKDIADFDPRYSCKMAFTGELSGGEHHGPRTKFIQQLKNKIDIKVFPTKETGNTRFQTAELATSADSILGMQMGTNIPLYLDVRPAQYIGAGALYFHDKCVAMDTFFQDKVHYISYERNNAMDLKEKHNYYINNKELSNKIRKQGFEFGQKYHSTKIRVKAIIDYFEGKELQPIYLKNLKQE